MSVVDLAPIGALGDRRKPQRAQPFGRVEQREFDYMRRLRFDAFDRLLFTALKIRYDARSGTVTDRITTLADWSGMSERRVQACLKSLQGRGVIKRERHASSGGPRGHAWRWSTTIRPYEDWPTEPLAGLDTASPACGPVIHGTQENTRHLRAQSERSMHRIAEEDARNCGRGRAATTHNQESSPNASQERDDLFDAFNEEDLGNGRARRLGKLWVTYREAAGLKRFTDGTAVRWLVEGVRSAVEVGCSSEDLEKAVEHHSKVDFADPRDFISWARTQRDERLQVEREGERSREYRRKRQRQDAEVDRLRAQPGYAAELERVVTAARAQLKVNT